MLMFGTHGMLRTVCDARCCPELLVRRPMSQISAIFGTDSDEEILTSLYLIANVCPIGSPSVNKTAKLALARTRMAWA